MSLGAKKLNSSKTSTTAKGVVSKSATRSLGKPAAKGNAARKIAVASRAALINKPNGTAQPKGGAAKLNGIPFVKPVPAPIDPRFEPFRALLEAKRAELAGSLGDTRLGAQAQNGRVAEEDQAAVSHEEFISSKRNSMEFRMLRMVNAALDRITRGEYGLCHACDEEISEKRLKVIPWAEFCVRCQDSHGSVDGDSAGPATPGAVPALQVWNW